MILIILLLSLAGTSSSTQYKFINARWKRESDPSCKSACDGQFRQAMGEKGLEPLEFPFGLVEQAYSENHLNVMCRIHDDMKPCYSKCGVVSPDAAVREMICNSKKEYLDHAQCFNKTDGGGICALSCAGKNIGRAMSKFNQLDRKANSSAKILTAKLKAIGPICRFLNCAIKCLAGNLKTECGTEAAGYFQRVTVFAARTAFGNLFELGQQFGVEFLPAQCAEIMLFSSQNGNNDLSTVTEPDNEKRPRNSLKRNILLIQHKLQLKALSVMAKTEQKLDLELEKLKLEIQLLRERVD